MHTYLNLYFIAGTQDCRHLDGDPSDNLLHILEQALQGGITCYQFREKGEGSLQDSGQIRRLAQQCRDLCQRYHVPFFVNNDVALALELGADGVHVGQDDMPIEQVIQHCQGKLKIGLTINNLWQGKKAAEISGIDYFGVGPIFSTQSKVDAKNVVGIELIKAIRMADITQPIVAIGGINTTNCIGIRRAGADGLAVISAITRSTQRQQDIAYLLDTQ
ncbi:thiamine phosphate synthase [Conservatibacter flavescens]|uniref:Thiamine-phosphate synthase n=1 Tax=Conservatibacter flavescens TaxID=28161 RepID=A0A2M8S4H1_9PAST|nr:thiamine phosphate synthase [Conservatibacter flavescens]PJG86032.1 thiamine phosphate synthase [Conservatibacter flavescens]